MGEYIELEAALEKCGWYNLYGGGSVCAVSKKELAEIPAAHVAPVRHGQWVWDTEDVYICTRCGEKSHVKEVMGKPVWDWRPNCGAMMDGGAEDA